MILKPIGYAVACSLVFCVYLIAKKHLALRNSDQFEGSVVGYERRNGSRGRSTYALKVEYKDGNAVSRVFVAPGASSPPARPLGARVLVFQHRDGSPADILVFESTYLVLWIWLCVGLCAVGCLAAPYVLQYVYAK